MQLHGGPAELQRRRVRALQLFNEGLEPNVVAHRLSVDRRFGATLEASLPQARSFGSEGTTRFRPAPQVDRPGEAKPDPLVMVFLGSGLRTLRGEAAGAQQARDVTRVIDDA